MATGKRVPKLMPNPTAPNIFTFESQTEDEKVILVLRAHGVTNIPWIFITIILTLAPLVLVLSRVLEPLIESFKLPSQGLFGVTLLWYLFVFAYAFQNFLSWYFNIYLVTNERVVDMDFFQLLYRKISGAELRRIEDVSSSMGGVSQVIFNYGDIRIQTAGAEEQFLFERVPKPAFVQKTIEDLAEKDKGKNEP